MPVIAVNLFTRDTLPDRLHHAVGAHVAIVIGLLDEFATGIEQRVVAAPGVDADAFRLVDRRSGRGRARISLHSRRMSQRSDPLSRTGPFGNLQISSSDNTPRTETAEHRTAALGSEIDGEEMCTHRAGSDQCRAAHRPHGRDSIRRSVPRRKSFAPPQCLTFATNARGGTVGRPMLEARHAWSRCKNAR